MKYERVEPKLRVIECQELNPRELNAKQVCALAFIVSNKVCIATITTYDLSGVIILTDINL